MTKTNYFATIFDKKGKKVAERRVHVYGAVDYTSRNEYVYLKNALLNVDMLLEEGYKIYYRFVPSHVWSFGILDCALTTPFERKCRA